MENRVKEIEEMVHILEQGIKPLKETYSLEEIATILYDNNYRRISDWVYVKKSLPNKNMACYCYCRDGARSFVTKLYFRFKPNLYDDYIDEDNKNKFCYIGKDNYFRPTPYEVLYWKPEIYPEMPNEGD